MPPATQDDCVFRYTYSKNLLTKLLLLCILYISNMNSMNGGKMVNILISNSSGKPIYEQIFDQIRSVIVSGELAPGDSLPSIRTLAKDLRISVITTQRAYDELEKSCFIHIVAGKGCYVAEKNMDLVREDHLKQIEEHMTQILDLAKPLGLSREELNRMFALLMDEQEV